MLGIIVVTHSTLCNGLIESGEFISGKLNNVRAVSLDSEGVEVFRNKLEEAVDDLEKECEAILFMADLKCATPYNALKLVLELEWREYVKATYLTEEEFSKIQVSKNMDKDFRY